MTSTTQQDPSIQEDYVCSRCGSRCINSFGAHEMECPPVRPATIPVRRTHVGPDGESWGSSTTDLKVESPLGILMGGVTEVRLTSHSGSVQTYTRLEES